VHAPVGDQDRAGHALLRHVGKRRGERGEQSRAVSLSVRLSGLMEILPHPKFAQNQIVYLTYTKDVADNMVATTLAQFKGHLDVLVNNASTIGPSPMPNLLDYPVEDFREVLDTNLIGPFLLIKNALPAMIERDGSIINVTSDAGQVGYPGWGAYGISKFGLEGMSQTWASELEESGVRVNWVDPGSMNTAMHRAAEPEEDPSEWANPADVTEVFVFLASDESKGVTGKRFRAQENWKAELNHEGHEEREAKKI